MLDKITRTGGKIVGARQKSISQLYEKSTLNLAMRILEDASHPLFPEYTPLPPGRRLNVGKHFYSGLWSILEMQSQVKHNLHPESEAVINKLINIKLTASYTYLSLGMFFDRDDVALPSFSSYFLKCSVKERKQAESLLGYQNMRGGLILLQTIAKPSREDWKDGLDAMTFSLEYQKSLNQSLLELHHMANNHTDPHLCDFLEQHFLSDSHDAIKQLGDYVGSLTRLTSSAANGSMGEYLFDKHTL
ncbi:hypothetical protein SKAU_G00131230 [Synaphobranchus kaupii]|uniref:Ferritin n=1 Tax=Synaphobranchus kaupii TaxID=118154 RepID=A0A9Q1J182_SYNKA|nr:hypothetical protein SKAU_G00131230 [Synaphobranchus kaupii]